MTKKYQIVGVGNALVDVLAHCEDSFLAEMGIDKGVMQLIQTDRAAELYGKMAAAQEVSGGSGANTIAGIAALGGRTGFIAKVRDDQLGNIFAHDIQAQGTDFISNQAPSDHPNETGRCLILVTPDGERSMNTYLGVSSELSPDDLDLDMLANTDWAYLEGYLFDSPDNQAAFYKTAEAVAAAGGKVALTLSDPFCVDRHRDAFRSFVKDHVDLLFCNEHEVQALYQTETLDAAMDIAMSEVDTVACTASEKGAYILNGGEKIHTPATATKVVDATGAGDLFAAGFLHGLTGGRDLMTCGTMGCVAAAEAISHMGARPDMDLKELFAQKGLA
jgi:sugar/nucleoside kinase (ribokinase family)